MGTLAVGSVVLVKFPFSDLSGTKLRPAFALCDVGSDDWILLQITSNPYADVDAIEINNSSFETGGLQRMSFIRPGKIFTANLSIVQQKVGQLRRELAGDVLEKVIALIRGKH